MNKFIGIILILFSLSTVAREIRYEVRYETRKAPKIAPKFHGISQAVGYPDTTNCSTQPEWKFTDSVVTYNLPLFYVPTVKMNERPTLTKINSFYGEQ